MIDKATLTEWAKIYSQRKKEAYRRLVESYTEEQKALIAEMNRAARQERLCSDRLRFPNGATGKREKMVAWPVAP